MAARISDRKKKKIIADYLELGSYRAAGKQNGVSGDSVKRIVENCGNFKQKMAQKKEENDADILAYMESKRDIVCEIIGKGLSALNEPDKLNDATPAQITTALGTLIDKWSMVGGIAGSANEDDPLSASLRDAATDLESDPSA